ncbi:type 2 periplasmic-binding domain-containing protein [Fundicoccus culcitae]|uniref:ABC transporter substrate-binding protein n=1 Tax=Fundicoccus culcitae TaxID=2969821 RepID=A0ABY5P4W4_9LACT|nr:ABC transporter substrate-binding protein [Fundicoccus culcitae]UUX33468.1 ABC transporter substrate-binding protein [Fundicoccus culcitae]
MVFKKLFNFTAVAALALSTFGTALVSAQSPQQDIIDQEPTGVQLVIGTNNTGAGEPREAWLLNAAEEAGFNIQLVSLGGGDLTSRVIAEANNPTMNVVWGPSEDNFNLMVEAGALTAWEPAWADKVEGSHGVNGYSWPYEVQPKLYVANPNVVSAEELPTTISQLWEDEAYHGKYMVPKELGGAQARMMVGGILAQYLDESGELGVSEAGWAAIEAYFANGYQAQEGEDEFVNLVEGTVPYAYTAASLIYSKLDAAAADFETPLIVYFEEGAPTNTNHVGVVNSDDQAIVDESIRFANWIGSADVIGEYAADNGTIVTNVDAVEFMDPRMQEINANFKWQEADWTYINSRLDEWVAKILLEYMP